MATAHLAIDLGASSGRVIIGMLKDSDLQRDPHPSTPNLRPSPTNLQPSPINLRPSPPNLHPSSTNLLPSTAQVQTSTSVDEPTTQRQLPLLTLEELHRFEHLPCPTPFGPVWDLTGIWLNILTGLRQAARWCRENQIKLRSIGVDAWGVDWCLVGQSGELLTLPHCYRDPQNEPACQAVLERVGGKAALYQRNGIQLMSINTLFQVAARFQREPKLFEAAGRLLFVPDLFHYWLSGQMQVERTIASTSAMLDLQTGDWDFELLHELGFPRHLFGSIIEPGAVVGNLLPELAQAVELSAEVEIISPGAHDTAAAVAAVPAQGAEESWAYLSSGTWSLLGVELDQPFADDQSCAAPFTNERGVNQSIRFLKNIAGLWLIQELKRELDLQGQPVSFAEMVNQARAAEPLRTLVNPNDARFAIPGGMSQKLRQFAEETDQPVPQSMGELVRCCLESLAFSYRDTVDRLEQILNVRIAKLHVVGGGTQNELLNELTAATLQRPVICGPVEATAIGNLLIQSLGCGIVPDLESLRQIVAHSFWLKQYDPIPDWHIEDHQFARYRSLIR